MLSFSCTVRHIRLINIYLGGYFGSIVVLHSLIMNLYRQNSDSNQSFSEKALSIAANIDSWYDLLYL